MAEDADIVAVTEGLVVVHGPVHHGLPRDVVAPVGVEPEGGPDIVEAWEEVESVPGTLSGRLLARDDLVHSGVRQGGLADERVGEDGEGVDGRFTIDISIT